MVSHEERLTQTLRYVEGARQIISRCGDAEARQYWNHLCRTGAIVAPDSATGSLVWTTGLRIVDQEQFQRALPTMLVTLLFPEDYALNGDLRAMGNWQTAGAVYKSENNHIFLRSSKLETDFIYGCTLLHEVGHSYRAWQEGRLGKPESAELTWPILREEGAVHYMIARLWRQWGGQQYEEIMQQAVRTLHEKLQGQDGFVRLKWNSAWLNLLDTLFGPAPTPKARHHRMGLFTVHAHFAYIEQRAQGGSRINHRAEIIRMLYQEMKHRQ